MNMNIKIEYKKKYSFDFASGTYHMIGIVNLRPRQIDEGIRQSALWHQARTFPYLVFFLTYWQFRFALILRRLQLPPNANLS